MDAFYNKRSDIFYVKLAEGLASHSVEHPWGLVDIGDDGEPIGIELWEASKTLPADMIGVLEYERQAA